MLVTCINKKSPEYQALKNKSGISDFLLESICRDFLEKYDRFPHLDEIPEVNSEPYLREHYEINSHNGVKVSKILESTGSDNIESANAYINDEYRDLEVSIIPIEDDAVIDIQHKPTDDNFDVKEVEIDNEANSYMIFDSTLQKLSKLYGIKFNIITDLELNSDQWRSKITDPVNAFIYNNEIYINIDKYSVDSPIHELMHMFIGAMRFTEPRIYQQLVNSVMNIPEYKMLIKEYPNRTQNDVNEEIFVTEVSKYLVGLPSVLDNASNRAKHEIAYNIKRMLDIMLMGQDSVKTISDNRLFGLSLKDIAKEVNSSLMTNKFKGTLNIEGSELHRKLNNIKSDLIKQKLLEERCD